MAVALRPMVGPEIAEFLVASRDGYVAERTAVGDDAAAAARAADEQVAEMFPGGRPALGHLLYWLEEDGRPVGTLWIGPASAERPQSFFVWDIEIAEAHRGRGLGKAAMLLAESEARARGAAEIGLSVFGHNAIARQLYESLGYSPVSIRMAKAL